VNDNVRRVTATLRAVGSVDGQFRTPEGGRRSYHLDGTLFYLAPSFLRFDLKTFGERQFLFGSNPDRYWVYSKEAQSYRCGAHGRDEDLPPEVPIRPDQLIDALGLTPISPESHANPALFYVQRIESDVQQILFILRDSHDRAAVEKEYWLDRFPPRLVRRVVFRDACGAVTMESTLDDYRAWSPDGPMLPHKMSADWPTAGSKMHFRVTRWSLEPSVSAIGPQFAIPQECRDPR
jgi:hypothetical protein